MTKQTRVGHAIYNLRDELEALFRGYGYTPHFVEGDDPSEMHQLMAAKLEIHRASSHHRQRK